MSRRRYVSTLISLDPSVGRVCRRSDFAGLLWTWMIPHAEEDATITGDADELLALVFPQRRDKEPGDVSDALDIIESEGLFEGRWPDLIAFKTESFYRIQSMIAKEKRRTAPISRERQRTPENAASFGLGLGSSLGVSKDKPFIAEGIHEPALGKLEEKLRRQASADELDSMRSLCKQFPSETLCVAISQAFVQINEGSSPYPDNLFGFVASIAKGEAS